MPRPDARHPIFTPMKLYFLRHGLAGDKTKWKGDDALRPLTKEGVAKMKRIAATLQHLDLGVDVIITSPLARATQTAEIAARQLHLASKMVEDARLAPGFDAEKLRKILREYPSDATVMVVGHEPDFSDTIAVLIGGGHVVLKKGGLALVELPGVGSRRGELVELIQPKVLAR